MRRITVVVAHRERASRERCFSLLQSDKRVRVVAEAQNGFTVIAVTAKLRPRILLLDFELSLISGFALLPVLRQKSPGTKVILLTTRAPESRILNALSHGATGYLEQKALGTFLAKAVRAVDAGEAWVPRRMVAKVVERLASLTLRRRLPASTSTRVDWTKVQCTKVQ